MDRICDQISSILCENPSLDFNTEFGQMKRVRHLVNEEVARRLQTPLNSLAENLQWSSESDKAEFAKWTNRRLKELNLAAIYPGTEDPAILTFGQGRFRLQKSHVRGVVQRSASSKSVPFLELRPDSERIEGLSQSRSR